MRREQLGLRDKWLLVGHYGAGNAGDEAMWRALVASCPPEIRRQLVVVSKQPVARDVGTDWLRLDALKLVGVVPRVRGLILGGGTHFHDEYMGKVYLSHVASMSRHLFLYALARFSGTQVLWIGVGVGPLRRRLARTIFRLAAATCSTIAVRDIASYERCRRLIPSRPVERTFDLAVLLEQPDRTTHEEISADPSRKVLGVSVMNLAGFRGFGVGAEASRAESNITRALSELVGSHDRVEIRVFVVGESRRENDVEASERIYEALRACAPDRVSFFAYESDPAVVLRRFAGCDAVFATRYHSLLFTYMVGRRALALAYNQKVADLAAELGLKRTAWLTPDDVMEATVVLERLARLIEGHADFRPSLPIQEARRRAWRNIEKVTEAVTASTAAVRPSHPQ